MINRRAATRDVFDKGAKTTCELYHAALTPNLLPSVQASLYHCLHFSFFSGGNYPQVPQRSLKKRVKAVLQDQHTSWKLSHSHRAVERYQCDVIFSFFNTQSNYFGIQKQLAKQCQAQGLRTGMVSRGKFPQCTEFDDGFLQTREFSLPEKIEKKVVEQCRYILSHLENSHLLDLDLNKRHLDLVRFATQIERQAIWMKHLFELKSPKLVILTNAKDLQEVAMQIACTDTGTPSMLIPHGFPQRSQYPLAASLVMSYCPHHDNYLKELSLVPDQVRSLGWLEPRVALSNRLETFVEEKFTTQEKEKYKVLFLSQLSGWEVHRCLSVVDRMPPILKALDKMHEIETITLRLRPNEINNIFIKTLLAVCGCSKLKISTNEAIADDLQENNTLMSFSSTGLMYGPYLGMRAIEIRDETINSVWGGTVLPSKQVYQIGEDFEPDDFSKFIANSRILNGQEVFHNWGSELESFTQYLNTIV